VSAFDVKWDFCYFNLLYSFSSRYTLHAIEASSPSSFSLTSQLAPFDTVYTSTAAAPTQPPTYPLHEPQVCREGLCRNGGTCRQLQLPGGALPSCHCPLHFTGTFCEKGRHEDCLHSLDSVYQFYTQHTQEAKSFKTAVPSALVSPRGSRQIVT